MPRVWRSASPWVALRQAAKGKNVGQGELIGNKGVRVWDFAPGKAALMPSQESWLSTQLLKFLTIGVRLTITGHSSSEEDAGIVQKRAESVAAFLRGAAKHKVRDENLLQTKGVGAPHPSAPETDKDKAKNEANRKRNRRVEVVMTTAEEFVGGGDVGADVGQIEKGAPEVDKEKEMTTANVAKEMGKWLITEGAKEVLEETLAGFAQEFLEPAELMKEFAEGQQNAINRQLRHAYCDGIHYAADAAHDFIGKQHAGSVRGDNISSVVMSKIDANIKGVTYTLADAKHVKWDASKAITDTVAVFNDAMKNTEASLRERLVAKRLKHKELQSVYDKIVGDLRWKVAYELADKLKEKEQEVRRG